MDLGEPIAYLALEDGVPVYSSDGERIGTVEHVLAVPEEDIFDGIVIDTRLGPGGHRFADAPQVAEIHENGVLLSLGSEAAARLPEPSENPAVLDAGPDETVPDDLGDKLRRAWQRIFGDY